MHLQRNLLFRKLFHFYEENFWNNLWRRSCFSVYRTPGYIYVCLQDSTLKIFDISFTKPPSRKCMITHLEYSEDKVIYFLYIFILINTHTHTHTHSHTHTHTHTHTHAYIYISYKKTTTDINNMLVLM